MVEAAKKKLDVDTFRSILSWPDEAGVAHLPLRIKLFQGNYARLADEVLAEAGTTVARFVVLTTINAHPGLTGVQLAEMTFQKPQSLADLTRALEAQQLIQRRNSGHGRSITHHVTPAGHALVVVWRNALADLNRQVFKGFAPERIARLVDDIDQMSANLTKLART